MTDAADKPLYETLPQHLARAYPDGPPPGLIPVRLCPVQAFGADECDRCMAPASYGLMDAASAWSDCNRAYGHIYRRDEPDMNRLEHETIIAWVAPEEAEKFDRILGDPRGPLPVPHVTRIETGRFDVRIEFTAFPLEDPDAAVIEQPVPIPNDDPACACRIHTSDMAILGVFPDSRCPYHGDGGSPRDAAPDPGSTRDASGLVAQLRQEARGFVGEAMLNTLLYGQPTPELGYILPPDNSAEGAALRNEMPYGLPPKPPPPGSSTRTGLFDALGGVTPDSVEWPVGIDAGAWSTVRSDEIVLPDPGYIGRLRRAADPLETVVNAIVADDVRNGHPIARSKWAPADCTCPWPWPMSGGTHILTSCPHYAASARPAPGCNTRIGCQRHDSGTWVHGDPHDCPRWVRG